MGLHQPAAGLQPGLQPSLIATQPLRERQARLQSWEAEVELARRDQKRLAMDEQKRAHELQVQTLDPVVPIATEIRPNCCSIAT